MRDLIGRKKQQAVATEERTVELIPDREKKIRPLASACNTSLAAALAASGVSAATSTRMSSTVCGKAF